MAKAEKILRVNVPFRVLPETIEQLNKLAEKDMRSPSSMFEVLVAEAAKREKIVVKKK